MDRVKASPYSGCSIALTTKHRKSMALAPVFASILGANIFEHIADTDLLGTFSGEIERKKSPLETAKKKCLWSLQAAKAEYALASEGSFGPHPLFPFIYADREILYFVDTKRKFELYVTDVYTETNYHMSEIASHEGLIEFGQKSRFPSHALIIRPSPRKNSQPILKGIQKEEDLQRAFYEMRKLSSSNKVWVETDMRAHCNPTRMRMIQLLGETLARRLCSLCPSCQTPGWGKVDAEYGLPCMACHMPTEEIKAEVWGCAKCSYRSRVVPEHGKEKALPRECSHCNP